MKKTVNIESVLTKILPKYEDGRCENCLKGLDTSELNLVRNDMKVCKQCKNCEDFENPWKD